MAAWVRATVRSQATTATVAGTATTRFPFGTFGLEIPKLGFILSVDDDIRLEYDFRLVPAS